MTVRELISELEQYPQDLEVTMWDDFLDEEMDIVVRRDLTGVDISTKRK